MSKTAQSPRHTFADLPPAARAALEDMSLLIDEVRVYEFAVRGIGEFGGDDISPVADATADCLRDIRDRLMAQWRLATGYNQGGGR